MLICIHFQKEFHTYVFQTELISVLFLWCLYAKNTHFPSPHIATWKNDIEPVQSREFIYRRQKKHIFIEILGSSAENWRMPKESGSISKLINFVSNKNISKDVHYLYESLELALMKENNILLSRHWIQYKCITKVYTYIWAYYK